MAHSTAQPFMNLPTEVHLLIVEHCDHASKVALHQTSQYFRAIVDVHPPGDAAQQVSFLKGYELWPQNTNKHDCFKCRTMVPDEGFDDGQTTGSCAKNGTEAEMRLCIRCGLLKRLYSAVAPVSIRGKTYYRCVSCQGLQGWGTRCAWCCNCSKCLGFKKFEVVQAVRCPECGLIAWLHDVGPEGIAPAQAAQTHTSGDDTGNGSSTQDLENNFRNLLV
ncbi:hypothetical protein Asppvi_000207 [Aspergillus pseudoviridinutans]|uniref:F-box domain-containing protein n=1 Tax=Aspergillus pseudoviridinutans TaxID=1517512 RepID=A0A9P3B1D7_9EURO|nr:uncharacterized protein Asppvi_000207 [Aspergillus pseudoviridinutans]GIJ81707.1 hypothetical protein Asppvi_000207 [Aspergillus pseudoviridinutans]